MKNGPIKNANRRCPRVVLNGPCSILMAEHATPVRGQIWSASCGGVGVNISLWPTNADPFATFEILFSPDDQHFQLTARLAWARAQDARNTDIGAVLLMDAKEIRSRSDYACWLAKRLRQDRERAYDACGRLAYDQGVSLRDLQRALDAQSVAGGRLEDILSRALPTTGAP